MHQQLMAAINEKRSGKTNTEQSMFIDNDISIIKSSNHNGMDSHGR
jgi:hypothetical protein